MLVMVHQGVLSLEQVGFGVSEFQATESAGQLVHQVDQCVNSMMLSGDVGGSLC
jgi:hypothetical protein